MSLRYLSMLISMYRKVFWVPLLKARMINTWPWMYRSQSSRTVCFPSEPGLNLRMIPNNILELPSKIKSIWQSSLVLMGMFTYLSIGWVILILHVYTYIHVCIHIHTYINIQKERERFISRKLAHVIIRASKSEICGAGWQLETQGRVDVAVSSPVWRWNSFFLRCPQSFLLMPAIDWMMSTLIL